MPNIRSPFTQKPQILRGILACLAVLSNLVGDLLTLLEVVQVGALDRADVNENVSTAGVRLDKAVVLHPVGPLYATVGIELSQS